MTLAFILHFSVSLFFTCISASTSSLYGKSFSSLSFPFYIFFFSLLFLFCAFVFLFSSSAIVVLICLFYSCTLSFFHLSFFPHLFTSHSLPLLHFLLYLWYLHASAVTFTLCRHFFLPLVYLVLPTICSFVFLSFILSSCCLNLLNFLLHFSSFNPPIFLPFFSSCSLLLFLFLLFLYFFYLSKLTT